VANETSTPGAETMALPESDRTAPGTNGLFRTNYFNGRMLTAEALRREQVYWDYRARLLGEVHPAGVAWGLGLQVEAPSPGNEEGGWPPWIEGLGYGIPAGASVKLSPGLAFNGIGQPIAVNADFRFSL